jgi:hypothetical protein
MRKDGGSKHLWNVGKLLQNYMAQEPGRQPSLFKTIVQKYFTCSWYSVSKWLMRELTAHTATLTAR